MASLRILLLSIAAAIVYGLVHDQITVRVCIEYFTIGHPRIIASEDPTILGLLWGLVATWWAGLIIGVPLALAARVGSWPKLEAPALIPSVVGLLLVMAICAASAGILAGRTNGAVLVARGARIGRCDLAGAASFVYRGLGGPLRELRGWFLGRNCADDSDGCTALAVGRQS